ncbi:hypothetical protein CBR_g18845 [Chara braunii]|uniref:LamG-like jellyroll fold domain-containing protein n=1 Tax=Chara braunii TaxID=69332 RepID=A0A388KWU8_CHABU|nr:hypothetical protein CBR_g18845 [Chara braunii]|eukprot:GBG74433.1 hypothetical protein CBR_g18845 [Chara braunii]
MVRRLAATSQLYVDAARRSPTTRYNDIKQPRIFNNGERGRSLSDLRVGMIGRFVWPDVSMSTIFAKQNFSIVTLDGDRNFYLVASHKDVADGAVNISTIPIKIVPRLASMDTDVTVSMWVYISYTQNGRYRSLLSNELWIGAWRLVTFSHRRGGRLGIFIDKNKQNPDSTSYHFYKALFMDMLETGVIFRGLNAKIGDIWIWSRELSVCDVKLLRDTEYYALEFTKSEPLQQQKTEMSMAYIPYYTNLFQKPFTIQMWVYPKNAGGHQTLLAQRRDSSQTKERTRGVRSGDSISTAISIGIVNGSLYTSVYAACRNPTGGNLSQIGECSYDRDLEYRSTTAIVPTKKWSHVAVSYNGKLWSFFVDGILRDSFHLPTRFDIAGSSDDGFLFPLFSSHVITLGAESTSKAGEEDPYGRDELSTQHGRDSPQGFLEWKSASSYEHLGYERRFSGMIYDVAFLNKVIDKADELTEWIQQCLTSRTRRPELKRLVGYWPLQEGSGLVAPNMIRQAPPMYLYSHDMWAARDPITGDSEDQLDPLRTEVTGAFDIETGVRGCIVISTFSRCGERRLGSRGFKEMGYSIDFYNTHASGPSLTYNVTDMFDGTSLVCYRSYLCAGKYRWELLNVRSGGAPLLNGTFTVHAGSISLPRTTVDLRGVRCMGASSTAIIMARDKFGCPRPQGTDVFRGHLSGPSDLFNISAKYTGAAGKYIMNFIVEAAGSYQLSILHHPWKPKYPFISEEGGGYLDAQGIHLPNEAALARPNGTQTGSPYNIDVCFGYSLHFDGYSSAEFFETQGSPSLGLTGTPFTLEAWFMHNTDHESVTPLFLRSPSANPPYPPFSPGAPPSPPYPQTQQMTHPKRTGVYSSIQEPSPSLRTVLPGSPTQKKRVIRRVSANRRIRGTAGPKEGAKLLMPKATNSHTTEGSSTLKSSRNKEVVTESVDSLTAKERMELSSQNREQKTQVIQNKHDGEHQTASGTSRGPVRGALELDWVRPIVQPKYSLKNKSSGESESLFWRFSGPSTREGPRRLQELKRFLEDHEARMTTKAMGEKANDFSLASRQSDTVSAEPHYFSFLKREDMPPVTRYKGSQAAGNSRLQLSSSVNADRDRYILLKGDFKGRSNKGYYMKMNLLSGEERCRITVGIRMGIDAEERPRYREIMHENVALVDTSGIAMWRHVAVTYDGETFRLYLDGELERTRSFETKEFPIAHSIHLPLSIGYGFAGLVDDIRLWRRARTQTEIQQGMYCPRGNPAEDGLVALIGFNDGINKRVKGDRRITLQKEDGSVLFGVIDPGLPDNATWSEWSTRSPPTLVGSWASPLKSSVRKLHLDEDPRLLHTTVLTRKASIESIKLDHAFFSTMTGRRLRKPLPLTERDEDIIAGAPIRLLVQPRDQCGYYMPVTPDLISTRVTVTAVMTELRWFGTEHDNLEYPITVRRSHLDPGVSVLEARDHSSASGCSFENRHNKQAAESYQYSHSAYFVCLSLKTSGTYAFFIDIGYEKVLNTNFGPVVRVIPGGKRVTTSEVGRVDRDEVQEVANDVHDEKSGMSSRKSRNVDELKRQNWSGWSTEKAKTWEDKSESIVVSRRTMASASWMLRSIQMLLKLGVEAMFVQAVKDIAEVSEMLLMTVD